MGMMAAMLDRTHIDLLQGTLGVLILKSLSWGPMHGYGIARWIEQITDDELLVEEGSLYPALHRLQARGLVSSEWAISDTNRRVKSYTITEQGRQQLRAEMSRWERFSSAISRALDARRPRTA
jgi:PadR family transcriptional regulator, regulatory protein PadR